MTLVALPVSMKSRRRWLPLVIATGVALIAVSGIALVTRLKARSATAAISAAKFYSVTPIDFDVKVSKDGEIAAVNNIDILNLVEGASTIVQIVKEGTYVHKGQTLVELDSSEIRQKLEDA